MVQVSILVLTAARGEAGPVLPPVEVVQVCLRAWVEALAAILVGIVALALQPVGILDGIARVWLQALAAAEFPVEAALVGLSAAPVLAFHWQDVRDLVLVESQGLVLRRSRDAFPLSVEHQSRGECLPSDENPAAVPRELYGHR